MNKKIKTTKRTRIYPDGRKYIGEYKDYQKHGKGTLTWSRGLLEGDKYVGEFKDGKKMKNLKIN